MHLLCIEKCMATAKCKFCFVQNKKDGVKNGKCQLFSACDITRRPGKSGRTFVIVATPVATRPVPSHCLPTTTTTSTTTSTAETTTTTAITWRAMDGTSLVVLGAKSKKGGKGRKKPSIGRRSKLYQPRYNDGEDDGRIRTSSAQESVYISE